jgi:hypothetical protein
LSRNFGEELFATFEQRIADKGLVDEDEEGSATKQDLGDSGVKRPS